MELSQRDAAREMQLQRTSLSRLERGRANFTLTQLRRAARLFRTEVSSLFLEAEAGTVALRKKGITVLEDEPPPKERDRWIWIAPQEVEQVVAKVKLRRSIAADFWPARAREQEEKLKVNVRGP